MRHVIVPEDLTATEIEAVFAVSRDLQAKYAEVAPLARVGEYLSSLSIDRLPGTP